MNPIRTMNKRVRSQKRKKRRKRRKTSDTTLDPPSRLDPIFCNLREIDYIQPLVR
jgi:hypothetical protein